MHEHKLIIDECVVCGKIINVFKKCSLCGLSVCNDCLVYYNNIIICKICESEFCK